MREDWVDVTLNDIAKWGSGGTPKSTVSEYYDGEIPWLIIGDLNDGYVSKSAKKITELGLKNSSAKWVDVGSVLIAMYGSIGKLGINTVPVTTNQAIAFTKKIYGEIQNKYLFYYLLSIRPKLYKVSKGGTQKNISQTVLKSINFPLSPLLEQKAIIAKIEQLFSELDSGIESLKRAKEKLKIYRQAVLKKAFEGELTKVWRDKQTNLPTADELLEQIKKEREEHYQKQLEEWKKTVKEWEESGKVGKRPVKPKKIKELSPLNEKELEKLSKLPKEWKWEKFNNLVLDSSLGKMLDKQKNKGHLKPYLRNINVRWGVFDLSNLLEMRIEEEEQERYCVKKGDLIICEGGEPGRCAVWSKDDCTLYLQKALHRVRFCKNYILSGYIQNFLYLSSKSKHLERFFTGTTIKHLTGQALAKVEIPICSVMEQTQIVQEIEKRLSVCDKMEATIERAMQKSEALRQSILKKAFEGRLLSVQELQEIRNHPDFESAEALLERIKREKEDKNG